MNMHDEYADIYPTADVARTYELSLKYVDTSARSLELINIHKARHAVRSLRQTRYRRAGQNEEEGKMAAFKIDYPILISDADRRELDKFQSAND